MQRLPFTRRRITLALCAVVPIAALTAPLVRELGAPPRPTITVSAPLVALSDSTLDESTLRDRDIAFYTKRAAEDRQSASDRLALASLLFTRSRSTGSARDLANAELLSRESIRLRSDRNGAAHELLASLLMSRHAFVEAHAVAQRADSLEPGTPSHLALLGEIELELGRYDAADRHFKAVHFSGQQFTVGARVARWYEITGRSSIARAILQRAIVDVDHRDDLPREQVAWFHYRLGELELRLGNTLAADTAFHRALARHPNDVRVLSGLARAALARGDFRTAIQHGEAATFIQLDPGTLATVSLAYAALDDSSQAARYASAMSISALSEPGTMHRAWGLYLLDNGSPAARADVLRRARQELRTRGDVYGHDLLAWALYRNGQLDAAQRQMQLALAQGTEDVLLTAHAAVLTSAAETTARQTVPPAQDTAARRRPATRGPAATAGR